jgi:rhodanese-related sulfurtransferase
MAYKNPLRLAKNGNFFVSDATTLTSYDKRHIPPFQGLDVTALPR